jgi:hypothetical protein
MKQIKTTFRSLMVVAAFAIAAIAVPLVPATSTYAECTNDITDTSTLNAQTGVDCAKGDGTPTTLFGGSGSIFTTVVNVLLFIIGAISVIMLIYGGIRYTISAGDSGAVTAAKNTILYAIVGLIVAFLAFAIVNFVLNALPGSTS